MKKVLFFITTLGGGGAERVLVNLVNNINPTHYAITVKTLFDVGVNRKYLSSNISYEYVFKRPFYGTSRLFKFIPNNILYKMFIKGDYDILVAYMHGLPTRIISGCTDERVKKIAWLHADMQHSLIFKKCFWNKRDVINTFSKFNAIVGVSKTVIKSFSNITGITERLFVKYNTNNEKDIISKSLEPINDIKFKVSRLKVCTIGRLVDVKGFDRLLKVHKRLITENINYDLFIFGEGEEEENLKKYIKENNLSDTVHLMGFKDNPYNYLKQCQLFVCSSRYEGLSTAVSESVIIGIPVITTMCSGMTEILGDNSEYGLIVNNDEESLYEGMKKLLTNEKLLKYYTEKSQERSSFFSMSRTIKEVERLLDEV